MRKTLGAAGLVFVLALVMGPAIGGCGFSLSDPESDNPSPDPGAYQDFADDDAVDDDQSDDTTDDDAVDDDLDDDASDDDLNDDADDDDVATEGLGGRCVALRSVDDLWIAVTSPTTYGFRANSRVAARFRLQPTDFSTYVFYDANGGYLVSEDGPLVRQTVLESDASRVEDGYISGAEWVLEPHVDDSSRYQLRNRRNDLLLGLAGLGSDPVAFVLESTNGCATYPEMSLDAQGQVTRTTFDDGTLFGIADIHEHLMSNFSFGGGLFHGGAYHRLGVAHALHDCSVVHGDHGRRDFFGYVFDSLGLDASDALSLVIPFLLGRLPEDNHQTAGWPDFPDWPDAPRMSTHQAMYHRWLERAWMGGLRLMVQHATSDYVICTMMVAQGIQPSRYDCEDMTSIDRIIDETWAMQRYIDALAGGEGRGWFRIVGSPAEAREVIEDGKLAVVLGIEVSNLFRCRLTPRPDGPECDDAYIEDQLDDYYARGVRAVFPVHKYDNKFSPGDSNRGFLEPGNFFNSGHWTNVVQDCPNDGMPRGWDHGGVFFGGLIEARDEYLSEAPADMSEFDEHPARVILRYLEPLLDGSASGDWCQNATITSFGETLLNGMMARGMLIEVDHLPSWSYRRAYEMLEANGYPAVASHGRVWGNRPFVLGGVASSGIGRCQDSDNPGSTLNGIANRAALIESVGGYPGVPLGFDLNGFAGAPGGRFAEGACGKVQSNPVTYPFMSYAGDVEFTAPFVGNRAIDFNTEGLVHIGMLPEILQDARLDAGGDDTALEPLFRSAEAYIRMWEKAEERAVQILATRTR